MGANAWPVGTGHPCFGCTEKGVGFTKPIFEQAAVFTVTPPAQYPDVAQDKGGGILPGAAFVAGAAAGAAAAAGIKFNKALKHAEKTSDESKSPEE